MKRPDVMIYLAPRLIYRWTATSDRCTEIADRFNLGLPMESEWQSTALDLMLHGY